MDIRLQIAIDAAIKAGQAILEEYNKPHDIEIKEDESPVTQADKRANDIIVDILSTHFEEHDILAEESIDDMKRLNNDWCWIVDPLDGTKEYIKRNGEFTVNIALAHENKIVLGVVYVPVTGELFYGQKGYGAFYRHEGKEEQIHVSDRADDLIVMVSRSHMRGSTKQLLETNAHRIAKTISRGSSLKGCMIAKGDADVYYRYGPTSEWDIAAMAIIIEEAGGFIYEMDDSEFVYNRENVTNEKGFYILNSMANKLVE